MAGLGLGLVLGSTIELFLPYILYGGVRVEETEWYGECYGGNDRQPVAPIILEHSVRHPQQ